VRVNAGDILAARRPQPDVQSARGVALWIVEDPDALILASELVQDRPRPVGRAPIDEDELGLLGDVLRLQDGDGLTDMTLLVKHRRQRRDRDPPRRRLESRGRPRARRLPAQRTS
jgi:hypothetical protein